MGSKLYLFSKEKGQEEKKREMRHDKRDARNEKLFF